jgi:hypothetical protein
VFRTCVVLAVGVEFVPNSVIRLFVNMRGEGMTVVVTMMT